MKVHKLAVVGCGMLAQGCHLPNSVRNERLSLEITCDVDPEVADFCRRKFAAKRACSDWREVIDDPEIDLVVLATRSDVRADVICPALEAGKAVYTEKPLAESAEEMERILKAVRTAAPPLCVGHNRRSSPAILHARRLLQKVRAGAEIVPCAVDRAHGRIGRLLPEQAQTQILMRINDDCRSWKEWVFNDAKGVGFAEMVHFIDLALWFNASAPVRVLAEGSPRGNFVYAIRFQDGSITTLQHTLAGHWDSPKELIEITANHATIVVDHCMEVRQRGLADEPFRTTFPLDKGAELTQTAGIAGFHEATDQAWRTAKPGEPPIRIAPDKGHYTHMNRLLDCMEGKGDNPCDAESAIVTTRLTLRLLESLRLGLPVAVGPEVWHIPDVGR